MQHELPCPECGRPFPADAPEEVCPSCSLQSLLKFVTADSKAESSPSGASAPATINPLLTARFGDYELLELLARGGMGVVYKARQVSLNRTVALKMIQAGLLASPAEVKRFHAEAEAVAHLQHPNIVAVHEIGEHNGQHYFSMDYVTGRTLADVVRDGPLPALRAATYAKTIASAVHYAHQHGIIHRDLKPANVIIDENDQPRITDFGLAKRLSDSQFSTTHHQLTLSGQVLGSPNYLPPEQAEPKRGALGPPSDVYSLGAILYHLLTGRPPFQAESLTTLLRQVVETDPVAPRLLNPGIPRDLETICLKCLEKEQQHRYATAQALADDLGRFLNHDPVLARPVGASGKALRWCLRRPVLAGMTGMLALVLVLGIVGISWQWRRAERERDIALRQAYAGDMNLVQRSLEEGDLGRARGLLDRYRAADGGKPEIQSPKSEKDLRGWEWRYLWSLCRSDGHHTLTKSSNAYSDLALTPDGKLLAVRNGASIELWDLATRQHTTTLSNQSWSPTMRFTPDGRFLVSGNHVAGGNAVVSFWDIRTRQIDHNLPQPSTVASLALSSDGTRLATFHMQKEPRCRVWELPSGHLLWELPTTESLTGTTPVPLFSPDGTMLALGENNGQIRLLSMATATGRVIPVPVWGEGVYALAFSPDGRLLASSYGWTDTTIHLWDVATGHSAGGLEGHRSSVERLAFAPDGQTLYSASFDQSIGIWDVPHRKQLRRLQGHAGRVSGLALSPDARTLISCSYDGSVRLWELPAKVRPPDQVVLPARAALYGCVFSADSRRLITASRVNPVTVWEVGTTNEIERIPALGTNNQSVALSPDERLLAVGGCDGTLKLWDLKDQSVVKQWAAYDRIPVLAVRFLDQGKSLLSGALASDLQSDMKRWEVGSWKPLSFGPVDLKSCFGLTQSPDQQLLASIYGAKPLRMWDSASGRLVATLGSEGGFTPVFSPDGRLVAAALRSCARIWEVGSWRQVAMLQQFVGGTQCVGFSPDGKRLVAGSISTQLEAERNVHIWDYSVKRELLSLSSQDHWMGWVEFSPDGNTLLGVSWYGLVTLWRAPSWAEIEAAEKRESVQ